MDRQLPDGNDGKNIARFIQLIQWIHLDWRTLSGSSSLYVTGFLRNSSSYRPLLAGKLCSSTWITWGSMIIFELPRLTLPSDWIRGPYTLSISNPPLFPEKCFDWLPGDTVGVIPRNCQSDVDFLKRRLGFDLEVKTSCEVEVLPEALKKKSIPPHIPKVSSLQFILESCIEIHSLVKKMFLRSLAEVTSESSEKQRLLELCSREGSKDFEKYFIEEQWTLVDLLNEFSSCKPPLSLLLEHLPRLQPRPYSIASSPLNHSKLRIIFSVVEKKRRKGLCSGWLFSLLQNYLSIEGLLSTLDISEKGNTQVPLYLRKPSKFRLPEEFDGHVIMIGPGTGLAPFLGFLEHMEERKKEEQPIVKQISLYYGCRYKERDFIYRKQLEKFLNLGIISFMYNSFSREADLQKPKYVQNALELRKEDFVKELIDENSRLFVCGDALNMVKDVESTVLTLISEVKGVNKEEASALYKGLENKGGIYKDVWR